MASDTQTRLSLIREVEEELRPLIHAINVEELARHNAGYRNYREDKFRCFVELEKNRFLKALDLIAQCGPPSRVCDLGCFIPFLPVALAKSGYQVKIVDKYEFYGERFRDSMAALAEKNRIELFDLDILADDFAPLGSNEIVLLMAVVEHLNGSPRQLLDKVHSILAPEGTFVFEVPNIAELTKRLQSLLGRSPLADYGQYFSSDYPFTGHNREMTLSEVQWMLEQSGFEVRRLECYDYVTEIPRTAKGKLVWLLKMLLPFEGLRQVISSTASRKP